MAVSYTHLDVYKRQACAYCFPPRRRADIEEINRVHETQSPGLISLLLENKQ